MKQRLTPQAKRSLEKKQHIYETAMRLFEEYGYEQTTIRDICTEAGITNSTFYNFFGDKLGVLLQYYYRVLSEGERYLEPTPENLSNPYQSICNFMVCTSVFPENFSKDIAREAIIGVPKMTNGNYNALHRNHTIRKISDFLTAAREAGRIPADTDPWADAEYLVAAASGVSVFWLTISESDSFRDVARRLMPRIFSAVTSEPIRVEDAF